MLVGWCAAGEVYRRRCRGASWWRVGVDAGVGWVCRVSCVGGGGGADVWEMSSGSKLQMGPDDDRQLSAPREGYTN
jgi:hypothetical protein